MPKRKRPKTQHQQASSSSTANGQLSHEEIWDDSALLRSWNDAVAEYDYYHSIHARGEDLDEVLRRAEEAEEAEGAKLHHVDAQRGTDGDASAQKSTETNAPIAAGTAKNAVPGAEASEASADEGEIEDDDDDQQNGATTVKKPDAANGATHTTTPAQSHTSNQPAQAGTVLPSANAAATTTPQDPLPNVSTSAPAEMVPADQTLENIKMAYYWAGYYSGLYDGQQQAQAQNNGKA